MGARRSSPTLVGRAEELAELEDAFGSVTANTSDIVTVLLSGDAGIGKSRLVDEFCSRARGVGALVATGACAPADGGGLPYGPVVGILRDLVRQLDIETARQALGPAISGLGLDLPGFGPGDAPGRGPDGSPSPLGRTRLFAALLASLATLAQSSPTVLVFEDLHWADSASAELFDFLTRNLRRSSILLIGTFRREEVGDRHPLRGPLVELGRHMHVRELRLQGLDLGGTTELLTSILGRQPETALVRAVHARSEGNPFFVEELTAAQTPAGLSEELRTVVLVRVDRMSERAKALLAVAATAGAHVDHRLLWLGAGLDPVAFDEALAECLDSRILVVDPEANGYRFRHTLLYESVYGALLPAERARLHRTVASTLVVHPAFSAAGPGHAAAERAAHWWAAGEWTEALSACLSAAEEAAGVFAFAEALEQFERALKAWELVPDGAVAVGRDRGAVLGEAADAAYFAGCGERAVELARAAVDAVDPTVDPVRRAVYLTRVGRNAWSIGESQASLDALAQAMAIIPDDPPSVELARILAEQARGLMLLSRLRESEVGCERAIAVARAAGARAEEGHATNTLGVLRAELGHHDEGIALMRVALAIAEETGDPDDLNRAYANLSHLHFLAGHLEQSAAVTLDGMALGESLGGVRLNGAALNSAVSLARLGRLDEAESLVMDVENVSGNCRLNRELLQAEIALRRGRFGDAARLLTVVDEHSRALEDVQFRGEFHMLRAALALEERRPRDAFADIEDALRLAASTDDTLYTPQMCMVGAQALADRAEQERSTGRRRENDPEELGRLAAGLVQTALAAAAPRTPGGACIPQARAYALMCRAEESRLRHPDPEQWDTAAGAWAELSHPYHVAYCRWREADALLRGSRSRSRAAAGLRSAWRITQDIGAFPLRIRIEQLAQRARIELDQAVPDRVRSPVAADLGLTAREVEVLGYLAAGCSDRQIAEDLFISKKTASVHVSNLLRKLDASNRIEAGEIGQRVGLG